MSKPKYYYAILKKKTGKLYLESAQLPIFWHKSVAKDRASNFTDAYVKPIKIEDLQSLLDK